jgi:hypothetical protein
MVGINTYRILVGKSEGKIPVGRPRGRWKDNIKINHKEMGYEGAVWIRLARDGNQWLALVNTVMKLRVL